MTPACMAALHGASFARGWSEAEIVELLAKPTTLALSTDAGFILLQVIVPEAEILTIVIDPALRGQGHGRPLLWQAVLAAQSSGVSQIFLEVAADNDAALALYQGAGFTRTGLRKGYYTRPNGPATDAVMMSLALQPGT